MTKTKIPYAFSLSVGVSLTWGDVLDGLDRHVLATDFARDKALNDLSTDSGPVLTDLAVSDPAELTRKKIEKLALLEPSRIDNKRLVYLLVAYLRQKKMSSSQLLDFVEKIYADFDYPPSLARAVRYMPMEGPDLGSREANERRLIANLDEYLSVHPDANTT